MALSTAARDIGNFDDNHEIPCISCIPILLCGCCTGIALFSSNPLSATAITNAVSYCSSTNPLTSDVALRVGEFAVSAILIGHCCACDFCQPEDVPAPVVENNGDQDPPEQQAFV